MRATTRITGPRAAGGGNRDASANGLDGEQVRVKSSLEGMLSPLPEIPGYGFALHYEPVSGVGGDFYDCSRIDEHRWFVALGDVSGHSVQGARVAVSTLSALRGILGRERDLVGIVSALNDEVRRDLPRGHFVTLFAGILDTRCDQLTCLCAGHHPALLASRNRARVLERVGNRGPALGLLGAGSLAANLRPATTALERGDTLFLYTDGLTEARNDLHSEYGLNRLMGSLIANLDAPYDLLVGQVVEDTRRFAAGVIDDDLSVLALSLEQPA
jgi:sigma-B regulation protein RsbU (phosphoserine phosphatase)